MSVWLVGTGKYGGREQLAPDKNVCVIVWLDLPDLSSAATREQLEAV